MLDVARAIQTDVSEAIQVNETACSVMLRFGSHPSTQSVGRWFCGEQLDSFPVKQDSCTEGRHWTLVLDGDWTLVKLRATTDDVLTQVLPEIERLFGLSLPNIKWSNVHWWKYTFSQSTKCEQQHLQRATSPSLAMVHRLNRTIGRNVVR